MAVPEIRLRLSSYVLGCCLCGFWALPCSAQELEPRRWSHLPMGMNFAGGGYAYSELDMFLLPALRIENMEAEIDTWAFKYIRSFELFERSSRIELAQAYQQGRWSGLLDGVPRSVRRSGFTDTTVRFATTLLGAPPLEGKEYAAYRAKADVETIVGAALAVRFPTGEYMDDKLINLGSNRFTFRPQLGVVHSRGKWSIEATGSAWIYTDNDDFLNGGEYGLDPLYTCQTHLIHTFRPGYWASASVAYGYGAESTIDGTYKDDRKGNLLWAFSFGCPITRQAGVQVAYIGGRAQESVGYDSDTIAVGFSVFW